MATYTKTTDFLAKDSLPLNNAAKYVKGSEIDTEYNNIVTADADNMKKSAMGTGVETFLGTPSSANLAAAVTGETGTGALVFATSPTLVTPALGTPASGTLTNCTGLPAGSITGLGANIATALAINVGSAGAPVLLNGVLGTPSSGTLTNAVGLPAAGVVGTALVAAAIGTTVQAYDADTAKLDAAQTFTAAQAFSAGALVSGVASFGYGTGAGDSVVQGTNRTTGVTINKPTGAITMFSAAGAATWSFFVVTNSTVAATDTISLSVKAGGATNLYNVIPFNVTAGAFSIGFVAVSGTAIDAPEINFAIIKAVTS